MPYYVKRPDCCFQLAAQNEEDALREVEELFPGAHCEDTQIRAAPEGYDGLSGFDGLPSVELPVPFCPPAVDAAPVNVLESPTAEGAGAGEDVSDGHLEETAPVDFYYEAVRRALRGG